MVFAEPSFGSNSQKSKGTESPNLRDLWRVSNPSKDTMPPQASPVVDRSCRVDHTHSFLPEPEPEPVRTQKQNLPKVKCVLIGDGTIGKTSLVVSYTTNGYPTEYVPTAFDNYSVVVTVDNRPIRLQLCDTAGQDDFDALRPLCYPNTDIFLVCFSVVSPTSFCNIQEKWIPEIRKHNPRTTLLLVGTQCDLRNDVKVLIELNNYHDKPVTEEQAKALAAEIGAITYVECSALTQKNLKEVFDTAILIALDSRNMLTTARGGSKKWGKKRSKSYKCSDDSKQFAQSTDSLKGASGYHEPAPKKGLRKLCCFL